MGVQDRDWYRQIERRRQGLPDEATAPRQRAKALNWIHKAVIWAAVLILLAFVYSRHHR